MPAKRKTDSTRSTSDRLEQEFVARALRKVMNKESLTREERRALQRYEKAKEEENRWNHYRSIPQKHWREMSGRQTKVINEQAARYGLPFGGATIDLPVVIRAFHDFLAANSQRLAVDDEALMTGTGSPALERYREERAAMARLDRLQREGALISRKELHAVFGRVAAILRSASDRLQREYGAEAVTILFEALEDADREIDRLDSIKSDEQSDG